MQTPSLEAILTAVNEMVAELLNTTPDTVKPEDRLLEDLGMDSLQTMELLSRLSEEFEVDPDMDDVVNVTRIKDVAALVERELAAL